MNRELAKLTQETLRDLRHGTEADILTCYFLNPDSKLFWLFFRDGEITYEGQMCGPLTYPGQTERLLDVIRQAAQNGVGYLDPVPTELTVSIGAVPSFVERERVARNIWLVFPRDSSAGRDTGESFWVEGGVLVILNYREGSQTTWDEPLKAVVAQHRLHLARSLLALLGQSFMTEEQAFRARNLALRVYRELEKVLVASATQTEPRYQDLLDLIAEQAFRLVTPDTSRAQNVVCTLSVVSPQGNNEVKSCWPRRMLEDAKHASSGIVDYVARAGQTFLIRDTAEYGETWKQREQLGLDERSFPQYRECAKAARSELACPMIIQDRVVGVLNIEADQPEAYGSDHVLMLLQVAALGSLVIRHIVLSDALSKCIDGQPQLVHDSLTLSEDRKSEHEIFRHTIETANSLGFSCNVWDCDSRRWALDDKRDHPRPRGYTEHVRSSKRPVALADVRGKTAFALHRGRVDQASVLLAEWEKADDRPFDVSDALLTDLQQSPPVLTDLGFPIFSDVPSTQAEVRAVLWAKCHRPFMSVLPDQSWALSFLCRNASLALFMRRRMEETNAPSVYLLENCRFHFGDRLAPVMTEAISREENLLIPQHTAEVVVLNVDIRGSTDFSAILLRNHQSREYADFITDFYEWAFQSAYAHGGVVCDTAGDAVQLLFHVVREDTIRGLPPEYYEGPCEGAKQRAVECALQIFQRFHGFLDKPAYTRFQGTPQSLALGAGLAVGDAFVGSFHNPRMALDFTALGVAANDAGKLQSCARPAKMLEWVQRSQTDRELVLELGGPAGRAGTGLTPVESSNLTGTAGLLRTCFALADPSFADAVAEVVRDRPVSAYRIRCPEEGTPTPRQGDRYVWIVVPRPSSGPE